jgi:hypothetical protein
LEIKNAVSEFEDQKLIVEGLIGVKPKDKFKTVG